MIQLSFTLWELALFIIAVAFIIGTVYAVKAFSAMANSLKNVNRLLEINTDKITDIVNNVDTITQHAESITDDTQESVTQLKNEVIDPLVDTFGKLAKIMQFIAKAEKVRNRKKQ